MANLYSIKIKDVEIPVKLNSNKNFKNFKISFNITRGYMNISKPSFMKLSEVNKYIKENEELIYTEYLKMLEHKKEIDVKIEEHKRKWITGEKLLYFGKEYELVINEESKNVISVDIKNNNAIVITIPADLTDEERRINIINTIKELLKKTTQNIIYDRLPSLSAQTKIPFNSVKIKYAKSLWGSCVKNTKRLNFSSRLAMLPLEVTDAIIIHELCHIVYGDHGEKFWNLVYKFCPNYKECDEWIKVHRDKFEIE